MTSPGQVLAPLAGAAAMLLVMFVLNGGAPLAIATGALVWVGFWLLHRHRRLMASGETRTAAGADDLMAAASRLETLQAAVITVQRADHRSLLSKINETAAEMLDQAFTDDTKRRQYRKALGHWLGHVEALATRIIALEQSGAPDAALMDKATALLQRLHTSMMRVQQAATEADAQDLDVRLSVIETEMDQELQNMSHASGGSVR